MIAPLERFLTVLPMLADIAKIGVFAFVMYLWFRYGPHVSYERKVEA